MFALAICCRLECCFRCCLLLHQFFLSTCLLLAQLFVLVLCNKIMAQLGHTKQLRQQYKWSTRRPEFKCHPQHGLTNAHTAQPASRIAPHDAAVRSARARAHITIAVCWLRACSHRSATSRRPQQTTNSNPPPTTIASCIARRPHNEQVRLRRAHLGNHFALAHSLLLRAPTTRQIFCA